MHPRFSELLIAPFFRPQIYSRAARLPPTRTFFALIVATSLCGIATVGSWYLPRSLALEELRGTELEQLPSMTIDESGLHCLRPGPEVYDADLFLVWLELDSTRPSPDVITQLLEPTERRPIVHISNQALVVYKRGEAPRPLPWAELLEREGRVSVSGDTIHDWLGAQLLRRSLDAWMLGVPAILLVQFLLLLVFVLLHRLVFRSPGSPGTRPLATAGAIAAIPPTFVATLLGLFGLNQSLMLGTYLLSFGLTFLFMSMHLRLQVVPRVSLGSRAEASQLAVGPLGGLAREELDQMKAQGLVGDEDYELALRLLEPAEALDAALPQEPQE